MKGVLQDILKSAYVAGFQHGIIARRLDAPSEKRIRIERRALAERFYAEEERFFNHRYQMRKVINDR